MAKTSSFNEKKSQMEARLNKFHDSIQSEIKMLRIGTTIKLWANPGNGPHSFVANLIAPTIGDELVLRERFQRRMEKAMGENVWCRIVNAVEMYD